MDTNEAINKLATGLVITNVAAIAIYVQHLLLRRDFNKVLKTQTTVNELTYKTITRHDDKINSLLEEVEKLRQS